MNNNSVLTVRQGTVDTVPLNVAWSLSNLAELSFILQESPRVNIVCVAVFPQESLYYNYFNNLDCNFQMNYNKLKNSIDL